MGRIKKEKLPFPDNIYYALSSNQPLVILMAISFIAALITFSPFVFGDKLFVYTDCNMDTYLSYIPQYELIVNYFREGMLGSLMNLSFNFGTDMLNVLHPLLDPFSAVIILIGVMFGTKTIAYTVCYVQILTILASAFCCYRFLELHSCTPFGNIIGSFCFAFSGYMLGAGQHYQFAVMTFLTIYSLLNLERYISDESNFKKLVFSFFLLALRGIYTFVMIGIMLAVYYLLRMISIHNKHQIKEFLIKSAKILSLILIAFSMTMFVEIEGIKGILNSDRVDVESNIFKQIFSSFKFNDFKYNYNIFLRALSELSFGTANNYRWTNSFVDPHMFMGIICIFSIVLYIYDLCADKQIKTKQRVLCFVGVFLVAFSLTNSFIPMLVHAFSYATYRFTMVLMPFFAYCIAKQVPKLKEMTIGRYVAVILTALTIVSTALISINGGNDKISILIQLSIILVTIGIVAIISGLNLTFTSKNLKEYLKILRLAVVFINMSFDGFVSLNVQRSVWSKDYYEEHHDNAYIEDAINHVKELEGDEFFRMETVFYSNSIISPIDYSYMKHYRSTSFYSSTISSGDLQFKEAFGNPYAHITLVNWYACGTYGEHFDVDMANTLAIKYILTDHEADNDWNLVYKNEHIFVYENPSYENALTLYTHYITESDLMALDAALRHMVLAQAAVVEDSFTETEAAKSMTRLTAPVYNLDNSKVSVSDVYRAYINNVPDPVLGSFAMSSYEDGVVTFANNITDTKENSVLSYNIRTNSGSAQLDVKFNLEDGSAVYKKIYTDGTAHKFNLPENWKSFSIEFNTDSYYFDEFRFLSFDNLTSKVTGTVSNENLGGNIKFDVTTAEPGLLYLPIEYNTNWSSSENNDLIKSNFAFTSVYSDAGNSSFELNYKNNNFTIGLVISIAGLAIFTAYCFWYSYSQKKAQKMCEEDGAQEDSDE